MPFRHIALLATVSGTFAFEHSPVLSDAGQPSDSAHPWVVQLCEDTQALQVFDAVSHIPEQMDNKPFACSHCECDATRRREATRHTAHTQKLRPHCQKCREIKQNVMQL